MTENSSPPECKFVKEEVVAAGKWFSLNKITYQDRSGRERLWECAARTTTPKGADADAVAVIPILRRTLKYDCVVCIKQYRPPHRTHTIEFPAGLIDAGETAAAAALRELREETGFVGRIKHLSPATSLDPGAESCTLMIASVEINGDDPENLHPTQALEETEAIEVVLLPLDELVTKLNDLSSEGLIVDSRVYSYAIATAHALAPREKEIREAV